MRNVNVWIMKLDGWYYYYWILILRAVPHWKKVKRVEHFIKYLESAELNSISKMVWKSTCNTFFSFWWKWRVFCKHFLRCYIFPPLVSWYIFLCLRHISQTCTEYSIQNVPFKYLCQRYILKSSIWVMLYNKLVNATFVFILLCS